MFDYVYFLDWTHISQMVPARDGVIQMIDMDAIINGTWNAKTERTENENLMAEMDEQAANENENNSLDTDQAVADMISAALNIGK